MRMSKRTLYNYTFTPTRVVDGDTVDGIIDLGFAVQMRERVRLARINAPETRTRDPDEKAAGLMAKIRLAELLQIETEWERLSGGSSCLMVSVNFRGKFGRIIGELILPKEVTGLAKVGLVSLQGAGYLEGDTFSMFNVSDILMVEGHAFEYPNKWGDR